MEKILSNKMKHEKLFKNGYVYLHDKTRGPTTYYVCERYYQSVKCKGRLVVKNNNDAKETQSHSHLPDVRLLDKSKKISELKSKAKTSTKIPRELVAEACASMSSDVASVAPTSRNLVRIVTAVQKEILDEKNPKSLDELVFSPASVSLNGESFLLFDSAVLNPKDDRIVIFGTMKNLKILVECGFIAMDGTFKVVPPLFNQLYSIHGRYKNNWIPLVYVLCTNKHQKTYEKVLNIIKELEPAIQPLHVIVDFERAAINAIYKIFPNASVHGCFFHLCQSVWRHVQDVGLQSKYAEDHRFARNIKMLMALALVPVVINAFEQLVDTEFWQDDGTKEYNKEKQALLNYFEATYIGLPGRTPNSKRREPLFPIQLWNMYLITIEGLPRTNNCVEGWHNKIASFIGAHHPQIFKFLKYLKKEQSLQEFDVAQIDAGIVILRRTKKNLDLKVRMENVVKLYGEYNTVVQYLKNVANNVYV